MSIIKIIVMAALLIIFMPYINNLLTLITLVLPDVLVYIISLAIVVLIVVWVVKE